MSQATPATPHPDDPPPLPDPAAFGDAVDDGQPIRLAAPPATLGGGGTFWRRPSVQHLVPWLTSLLFHLGMIGLALVVYQTAVVVVDAFRQEQIVIPDTRLVEHADAGGVPNPGIDNDPSRAAQQNGDDKARAADNAWANRKSDTLVANLTRNAAEQQANATPIGAAPQTSSSLKGLSGDPSATGGSLAPFGPSGGGGGALGRGVFGVAGGTVRKVAYVCDASGSMIGTLQTLLNSALRQQIEPLKPFQAFNIVFFQNDEPATIQKGRLLLATPENKKAAYDFLERYEVKGSTNPIPALREAFAMRPELVCLLTDGAFDEPDKVIAEINKLNADHKVKVNTILFVSTEADNAAAEGIVKDAEGTMKKIAAAHGGSYRLVRASQLQQ